MSDSSGGALADALEACFRNGRSDLTDAFSGSPLSRASRPFTGSILKDRKGSILPVRQAVQEQPLCARSGQTTR